jgi:fructose-bisphosphate aldolase class I
VGSKIMNRQTLAGLAQLLMAGDKGLLAMDESNSSCNKRFAALNIIRTAETRRRWRELIVTTPGLGQSISGAILCDETIRQQLTQGMPFAEALAAAGIMTGIKVDGGAKDMAAQPGEKITDGLDGLRDRLNEYFLLGARFAKWRAVITIGKGMPGQACIEANAHALARFAALCQEAGLVPVVEPEVLMTGDHSMVRCLEVTESVLHTVFHQLFVQGVELEAMILKPNMVLPGLNHVRQDAVAEIAEATVHCLLRHVPAAVPGVAFLSGGQTPEQASARLSAMNSAFRARLPWALTFSYSRAIQEPALALWLGRESTAQAAQLALLHRARCNHAARRGEYTAALEMSF